MADRELGRRLVHASGSAVPLAYVADLVSWPQVQALALTATAVVGTLEAVRLSASVDWVGYRLLDRLVYGRLIRSYEEDNPGGYALFVVGGTVAAFAFPPTVAVPAFLMLTIADPVSGLLADNEYGAPKRPAVLAVTFAVGGLLAVPFVPVLPAVLGALAATAADGFTPVVHGYVIDDNIGIPIGAGAAMWVGLQVPV